MRSDKKKQYQAHCHHMHCQFTEFPHDKNEPFKSDIIQKLNGHKRKVRYKSERLESQLASNRVP